MRYDPIRQTVIPAFLTLFVLVLAALWGMGRAASWDGEAIEWLRRSAGTPWVAAAQPPRTIPASLRAVEAGPPATAPESLWHEAFASLRRTEVRQPQQHIAQLPGDWLVGMQAAYPGWAALLTGLLFLFAAMTLGRMTVRYNLYGTRSCIAIPVFAFIVCALSLNHPATASDGAASGTALLALTAAASTALCCRFFCRAFRNGHAFDSVFQASFYLGIVPLLLPEALPLALLMPIAVMQLRRTLRETLVACTGLLLPALLYAYGCWAAGGAFGASLGLPFARFAAYTASGRLFALAGGLPAATGILAGMVLLLDLAAIMLFRHNTFAVGTKGRFILSYHTAVWGLVVLLLLAPGASAAMLPLLAVPSAVLIPLFLVRIRRTAAVSLYALLAAAAVLGIVLQ